MTNVSSCFPLPVAKINNGILNGSHIDPFEQFLQQNANILKNYSNMSWNRDPRKTLRVDGK